MQAITHHRQRLLRVAPFILAVSLLAGGCTAVESQHFGVDLGNGAYVRIYQKPSWQIVAYNDLPRNGPWFCGGDELCTLRFLRTQVDINWVGSNPVTDVDFFFDDSQRDDFDDALNQVRGTDPQRCLMLHRNANPAGDRHNWTSSNPGGSCHLGILVEA